jgi:hypothetical protein
MPARNPQNVAKVIAELWRGVSFPFPPFPKSFIALAGDARGTEIEVVPYTQENTIGDAEVGTRTNASANGASACHFAIATPLSEAEVLALAAREGWQARRCDRGGCFHVIEFWVENAFLLEVLTQEMQAEYLAFMKPAVYAKTFGLDAAA